MPDELIATHYSIFGYLDPKGFRYYLPAYMCRMLRNDRSSCSPTSQFPIFALTHAGSETEACSLLSDEEKRAICRFLRFLSENEDDWDASQALDLHWGSFCS